MAKQQQLSQIEYLHNVKEDNKKYKEVITILLKLDRCIVLFVLQDYRKLRVKVNHELLYK